MNKIGQFCWNELATPNVAAAKKFYKEVLNWDFIDHQMDNMIYTMIKTSDQEFGGIWQIPADQQDKIPPHWMGYILVESIDETLKKSQKGGGEVVMPSTKVGDFGVFCVIKDPTGAHIAFWESLKECNDEKNKS